MADVGESPLPGYRDERNVNRMINFHKLSFKDFTGKPLEILFTEVERKVDAYIGRRENIVQDVQTRSQCMYTHSLLMKYNLIIDIINNLGNEFGALKECTLKEISLFYFDPAKLMDIPLFTKNLIATLDKKSISLQFRTAPIYPKGTAQKKKGVIDEAKAKNAKDSPEVKVKFNEEYKKKSTTFLKEKEIQADLTNLAKN